MFVEEPPGRDRPSVAPNVRRDAAPRRLDRGGAAAWPWRSPSRSVAYLATGTIPNAVNVPSIPREVAPMLQPYLVLARRLGEFLAQVEPLEPRSIEVDCAGEASKLSVAPIMNTALAGVLGRFFDSPVNQVNAPLLAKDRGIQVRELKSGEKGSYRTLVTLSVTGKDGTHTQAGGSLAADGSPRLVLWGSYTMDARLEGSILVLKNEDRPGVIGRIGSILGDANINVSSMQMGLETKSGPGGIALGARLGASGGGARAHPRGQGHHAGLFGRRQRLTRSPAVTVRPASACSAPRSDPGRLARSYCPSGPAAAKRASRLRRRRA